MDKLLSLGNLGGSFRLDKTSEARKADGQRRRRPILTSTIEREREPLTFMYPDTKFEDGKTVRPSVGRKGVPGGN